MIFEYISPIESYLDIKIKTKKSLKKGAFGFLELYKKKPHIFINKEFIEIEFLRNEFSILDLLQKNTKAIVYIERGGEFTFVNVYFFYFYQKVPKLSISIDDKILKDFKTDNLQKLKKKLQKDLTIKINDKNYFLMGIVGQNDEEKEFEKESFLLFAEGYTLSIKSKEIDENNYELQISKKINKRPNNENNLILLETEIEFSSNLISDKVAKQMENIIQQENSYINVWDKFLAYESELLLDKARKIGSIKVKDTIPHKDLLEIILDKKTKLNTKDNITFFEKEPFYLNENVGFVELSAKLEQEFKDNKKDKELFFTIKKKEENSIFIEMPEFNFEKLKQMKVGLSIFGDKVQITRKLKARELILSGESANPFLGLLLEDSENNEVKLNEKISKIEPLSEFVEKKIFSHPATQNQKDAISIALNTPDIALIQGPPGTGKTTVITAIIERFNEINDKKKGSVLVTSYQHDAVLNLEQRLSVNSLPTVKFSAKNLDEKINQYKDVLNWAKNIKINAKQNIKNYSESKKLNELNNLIKVYLKSPSNNTALNVLEKLSIILPQKLDEINTLKKNFIDEIVDINFLRDIYSIRVNKDSFLDDGKEMIDKLLKTDFIKILEDNEIEKLKEKDIKYLNDYKKIRTKLIKYFYPKPKYQKPKVNEELIQFLDKIKNELEKGNTKQDKINQILIEYINEIENNPFALLELIKDYSFVFASSVQQSDRKEIEDTKDDKFYDLVIIDEAGRVPPMDLLIPMVKGRKIILVGDHRQLPHLVDEKIVDNISKEENIETKLIKKSMFEHLKEKLEKLEKKDGIKRVITLNNQYRTNPVMGEFISKNFYEPYEEGFNSPLPKELFKHNLKEIENKPCVWIDVPSNLCEEKKDSFKSTFRECEAKKIIEYLKKWIYSEEGEKLSYGIISFYKAQVNLIKELIKKEIPDKKDKIRVGSVDAFQGMEFDVVFLSATRSKKEIKDSSPKSLFGFLVSKNRLNVAMSRQKKVLIGVGDRKYFESKIANEYVPELGNFIQLCEKEGKIL